MAHGRLLKPQPGRPQRAEEGGGGSALLRLRQTANGVGKILGPLSIAVIAGTSNIVSPQATEGALTGGFLFLAAGMALVGLSFLLLGVETHGRAMTVEAEPEPIGAAAANRVERVF